MDKKNSDLDSPLIDMALLIKEAMSNWDERNQRHVQLLQALLELVLENPNQATEGFRTLILRDGVSAILNHPWGDDDRISNTVSNAWQKLVDYFETKKEGLCQRAQDAGLPGYPTLRKVKGGGVESRYFLEIEQFEQIDESPATNSAEEGVNVRYYQDEITDPGWLAKFLINGFQLSGIRKWLFLSVFAFSAIGALSLFLILFLALGATDSAGKTVVLLLATAIIFYSSWKSLGPFFHVLEMNITLAPGWLQPSGAYEDRLLFFERNMPDKPNLFNLVRYTGKCPQCGGEIWINRGGREFPGRLIGRCKNSPREHVFSFDHYLRTGKSLRDTV